MRLVQQGCYDKLALIIRIGFGVIARHRVSLAKCSGPCIIGLQFKDPGVGRASAGVVRIVGSTYEYLSPLSLLVGRQDFGFTAYLSIQAAGRELEMPWVL